MELRVKVLHCAALVMVVAAIIAILLFLADISSSYAESPSVDLTNLSLEELMYIKVDTVYGASKFEQKVTEAPSSVTIITADDIRKYGYRTLADILRSVRSFQITNDRNYSYAGVRGFERTGDYNSRILVLVDGHRVNDNIYDSALIGTEFIIDVDLIERVEVIRGPGSSLYGNSAFFAVINVITRKAKTFKGFEASGEAGSFRTYKGRMSYGDRFGSDGYAVFSATGLDSKGPHKLFYPEYNTPETNNGDAINADYDRNHSFFSKVGYGDFMLEGAYVSRTKGIPTGSFGTDFNDRNNRTLDERSYVFLKYEHLLADGGNIMGRLFYDSYDYRGTYIYSGTANIDYTRGRWTGAEAMYSKRFFDSHKATAGAEYQINLEQNQGNYDESPYKVNLDDRRHSKRWALYAQDEYSILANLILNAGVRYDHFDAFGDTTNPRAALIYSPAETTAIKLLYGTAFRAPNFYELYFTDGITLGSNPSLKPETIRTYELVLEQYFGNNLKGTASVFYNRIRDLITQQPDPGTGLLVFRNTDLVDAKGLELELEGVWDGDFRTRVSYTFQDTKDLKTRETPINSPNHLVKFNITFPVWSDKVFAGIEEQLSSRRKTLQGAMTGNVYVTNVTLFTRRVVKNLEFSASIYNLFDYRYGDPGAMEHRQNIIEQDGRAFRTKLTYNF